MSVIIKDAELPQNCVHCWYYQNCKPFMDLCTMSHEELSWKLLSQAVVGRLDNCPMKEVKE